MELYDPGIHYGVSHELQPDVKSRYDAAQHVFCWTDICRHNSARLPTSGSHCGNIFHYVPGGVAIALHELARKAL